MRALFELKTEKRISTDIHRHICNKNNATRNNEQRMDKATCARRAKKKENKENFASTCNALISSNTETKIDIMQKKRLGETTFVKKNGSIKMSCQELLKAMVWKKSAIRYVSECE